MPFSIDPEIGAALQQLFGNDPPPKSPKGDYMARRTMLATMFGALFPPVPDEVKIKDYYTTADDGHKILCRWYKKAGTQAKGPAVVYYHGGGFIAGSVDIYDGGVARYVQQSGVPFLSVDYRLAPEAQYSTNVKDAYAALKWTFENAEELGVDPSRITVMGDSGGGGMTAAVTHWNLEAGDKLPIAKQILIYPMLDDRNTQEDPELASFLAWNELDNATGWSCLLGDKFQSADLKPSAAPARMEKATGLPPAYIETGELDFFRNENILYAAKFGVAGISAELYVRPGCPHGFDVLAQDSDVSKRAYADRIRTLRAL